MKKIIVFFLLIFLTGCMAEPQDYSESGVSEQNSFLVTKQQQQVYMQKFRDCLNEYNWKYSTDNIFYFETKLGDNQKTDNICAASEAIGLDLSAYKDKLLVEAEADLLYFNSEKAGTVHFYFYGDELVGACYEAEQNDELVCALNEKNIFLDDVIFTKHENVDIVREFKLVNQIDTLPEGFIAIGRDSTNNAVIAIINEYKAEFYKYNSKGFYYSSGLNFVNDELKPINIMLFKQDSRLQFAIMLGKEVVNEQAHENEYLKVQPERIVFFNEYLAKTCEDLVLDGTDYYAMGFDNEELVLFNGKYMQNYAKENGVWVKNSNIMLESDVEAFTMTDLDGDNVKEYIMNDGKDVYMYHKEGNLMNCIWRTHISTDNFENQIFVEDLNGDGVKEIYLFDKTHTNIRYLLSSKGLNVSNENIEYMYPMYFGDFNSDGKMDYLKINWEDNSTQEVYLAQ